MDTMALNFNYQNRWSYPIDIVAGVDAISSFPDVMKQVGARRAMMLCGPGTSRSGIVERVQAALGEQCVGVYTGVGFNGPGGHHVPKEILQETAALAHEWQPDVLIGLGGGRADSTARALSAMIAKERGGEMPVIAVPTTISCAEISPGARRASSSTPRAFLIIDGRALATTPVRILQSTVFSQLRVAAECICAPTHNPIGDALALRGISELVKYAPMLADRKPEVLVAAKLAACLASLARFHSVTSQGVSTAVCHQAGGLYDLSHGEVHGIMFPHMLRFNLDVTADRQALIAEAMGIDISGMTDEQAGLAAAAKATEICKSFNLPTRLRDVGVPQDAMERIATATLAEERALATNPKPVTTAAPLMKMLQEAW